MLKNGGQAPLGIDAAVHVYLRLLSPASSVPRTESCTVVPVTGFDVAAAALAIVGA